MLYLWIYNCDLFVCYYWLHCIKGGCMTRQEQNTIILDKLSGFIRDLPNVQETIGAAFIAWFHALAAQGSQQLASRAVATPNPQNQDGGQGQAQGGA